MLRQSGAYLMHIGSILSPTLRGGSLAVAVGFVMWATALDAKAMSEQEAHAIGVDAYLYFYSLVTMDLTRKQLTNVEPGKGFGGPTNTFANVPAYPTAEDRAVVRPNFDTLYSSAWLDEAPGKHGKRFQSAPVGGISRRMSKNECPTAHHLRDKGVAGSNPATPTNTTPKVLITGIFLQTLTIWDRPAYTSVYTGTPCEWSRYVRTQRATSAPASGCPMLCGRSMGGGMDSGLRRSSLP
jgi:hypothetical protein